VLAELSSACTVIIYNGNRRLFSSGKKIDHPTLKTEGSYAIWNFIMR
jgi:hypothetical protein